MNLDCYNHYPAPIDYEPNAMQKRLKKVYKHLTAADLVLPGAHLFSLEAMEYNLVDDATIADLHATYMNDPTPTDVITFHHGEVFVSFDTAQREAKVRGIRLAEELFRYHVHGLLHLAGYDDLNQEDYDLMHKVQEEIVALAPL